MFRKGGNITIGCCKEAINSFGQFAIKIINSVPRWLPKNEKLDFQRLQVAILPCALKKLPNAFGEK